MPPKVLLVICCHQLNSKPRTQKSLVSPNSYFEGISFAIGHGIFILLFLEFDPGSDKVPPCEILWNLVVIRERLVFYTIASRKDPSVAYEFWK